MKNVRSFCNIANLLFIIIISLLSQSIKGTELGNLKEKLRNPVLNKFPEFQNDRLTTLESEDTGIYQDPFVHNFIIESFSSKFTFDASNPSSCDISAKDSILFKFEKPTNEIQHVIISEKMPLYGFTAKSLSSGVHVEKFRVFQDNSFKHRIFVDSDNKKMRFRDRWLVSVHLNKEVNEVEIDFGYNMQRAILIDMYNELNYLRVNLINPYPQDIEDYNIIIEIKNFEDIDKSALKYPEGSELVMINDTDFKISNRKPFTKHSELNINLSLPLEVMSCEGSYMNLVFYGIVFISILLLGIAIYSFFYIYKE
jgi:hypothetical protein